ncbi:E3 SUMO-protein ligase ZBED1-like [Melanotaenia boesemani]|uniref:E3 SUMO-protein ligase ZBED1-like n=1 Tax=Melanotaenia boesemani TaxID=1250792 RepID=UPI001C03E4E7|nr:E3 SUMO-protein ligase ZBED1-like [Melanotaenia boesemani]XP_041856921.1 E3 SUMO-protein ligase ZBED1-like [Melanotaenia boesemani]
MLFLEEATTMDPRFKEKTNKEEVFDRLMEVAVRELSEDEEVPMNEAEFQRDEEGDDDEEDHSKPASALGELFAEEDRQLQRQLIQQRSAPTIQERLKKELAVYRGLPPIPTEQDPVQWWCSKTDTLPLFSQLSFIYLCVQASSTPSERVFSTTGDTFCPERSRLQPEKVNMLLFLNKNC